ncbi:putative tricarboxylic transport membrane protein [Franzmannia pantelleriensis]|uniref:Putative tricarboxylic transport membrane protein n=1 Tax=Franzmannia pantelleriensis TaxID=48727 RepID=A0A1G9LV32_9GAMM|nr:tripartite tricarboxylate transporter permease [Halomonas pantelleriensis]SDL65591.1 putative tricarboxylic transport membrane protein [Halomonas pantelleriensis]
MFESLLNALPVALQLGSLVSLVVGTLVGILIGALPGLNPVMAIALMLPLTYGFDPVIALGLVAGIYNGSMYGGSIPAILLNIPGTPAAIATTFDGYPMTRKGQGGLALKTACWSSAIGGIVSALALMTLAPMLAKVTLAFGPSEYFWVAVFGLVSIAVLVGKEASKGMLSALLGVIIGLVGVDAISGAERYTFGTLYLVGGFELLIVLIGLYAIPPVLEMAEKPNASYFNADSFRVSAGDGGFGLIRRYWPTWARSSLTGVCVGILPGAGGNLAALLSYNEAKRRASDPDSFGTGNPVGVAAAESGNSADNASAMIPSLTLGIPGNLIAALVLGALMIHGLQPGPQLFTRSPDVVFGFMWQLLLTAMLLLLLGGMIATRLFAQILRMPTALLVPTTLVLMAIGIYTVNGNVVDLYVMLAFGMLGYLLNRLAFPLAPVVLGVLLGPMAEQNLRLSMLIYQNDWTVLFSRPISLGIVALLTAVLFSQAWRAWRSQQHS